MTTSGARRRELVHVAPGARPAASAAGDDGAEVEQRRRARSARRRCPRRCDGRAQGPRAAGGRRPPRRPRPAPPAPPTVAAARAAGRHLAGRAAPRPARSSANAPSAPVYTAMAEYTSRLLTCQRILRRQLTPRPATCTGARHVLPARCCLLMPASCVPPGLVGGPFVVALVVRRPAARPPRAATAPRRPAAGRRRGRAPRPRPRYGRQRRSPPGTRPGAGAHEQRSHHPGQRQRARTPSTHSFDGS